MEISEKNLTSGRVAEIIAARKCSLKDLATDLGIAYKTVHNYAKGTSEPTSGFFFALSEKLGISLDWFVTGEGEMYAANRAPVVTYNGNGVAVHQNHGLLQVRDVSRDSAGRGSRICHWVQHYLETHSADECAWLEVAMAKAFPEFGEWKKGQGR